MKFNEIYEGLLQGKKYRLSYWNELDMYSISLKKIYNL